MLSMASLNTMTYAKTIVDIELPGNEGNIPNENETNIPNEDEIAPSIEEDSKNDSNEKARTEFRSKAKSDSKKSIDWLSIIALFVGVGGVAFGGFCFMNLKALQSNFDKFRERNKKNFKELNGRIEQLQQENATYRQKIEKSQMDISMLQAAQSSIKNVLQSLNSQSGETGYSQSSQRVHSSMGGTNQPIQETVRLYSGVPRGGIFAKLSPTRQNESFYMITDNGGNTAKYTFIDDKNCAMVASRSTSDFLDPGCVISGPQGRSFSRVRTITPGIVRKSSNGWVIESKAVVELV